MHGDNSKLFICKGVCYKGLLKFQQVADNLQEVKKEIEEAFRAREKLRAKWLLRSKDGKPKEAPHLISHGNPRAEEKLALLRLVILQILTASPCLMLQGLLRTFLVCYCQLEIIRIVLC